MHRIALAAPSPLCGEGGWAPGHKRRSAVLFFVCACSINVKIFRLPRQSLSFLLVQGMTVFKGMESLLALNPG